MVKTALITVQGVAESQGYLYKLVTNNPVFAKKYHKIVDVPVDEVFSKKKPFLIKLLGKFGDKLDDMADLLYQTDERIQACRMTRNVIKGLQLEGYSTDLCCHSLGTLIALTSGPQSAHSPIFVDTTFLMGSPLGIRNPLMRRKTNMYVERYGSNFTSRVIHYLFSEEDGVSAKLRARTIAILEARSIEPPLLHHTGTSHDAKEYLDFLIDNFVVQ